MDRDYFKNEYWYLPEGSHAPQKKEWRKELENEILTRAIWRELKIAHYLIEHDCRPSEIELIQSGHDLMDVEIRRKRNQDEPCEVEEVC